MRGGSDMQAAEILATVDHTLLKQTATWSEIQRICEEAKAYHTATVMVPSCFIARIRQTYERQLFDGGKAGRDSPGTCGWCRRNRYGHQYRRIEVRGHEICD